MDKKWIIGISAGVLVILLSVGGWLWFRTSSRTKEAEYVAADFVDNLQNGNLTTLMFEYYAYQEEKQSVFTNDKGVPQARIVSVQEMVDTYGADALMISDTEADTEKVKEEITKDALLGIIMKHTQMEYNIKTVWGETSTLYLRMMMPDIRTWLNNLTEVDFSEINDPETDPLEILDIRMESGEIAPEYITFSIPMVKKDGKWRFQVTEETEQRFFGGMYQFWGTTEELDTK